MAGDQDPSIRQVVLGLSPVALYPGRHSYVNTVPTALSVILIPVPRMYGGSAVHLSCATRYLNIIYQIFYSCSLHILCLVKSQMLEKNQLRLPFQKIKKLDVHVAINQKPNAKKQTDIQTIFFILVNFKIK